MSGNGIDNSFGLVIMICMTTKTYKRKRATNNEYCYNCNEPVTDKRNKYCSTACYNTHTKTKGIDGYKQCKNCTNRFPYRNSLNVRSAFSPSLNVIVGSKNQQYCSKKCSLTYRNTHDNPAKTESGRKKISEYAKKRGTAHLNTPEISEKQSKSITGKNHWNWQNGKTSENKRCRNLKEYRVWRTTIFERDDYTCQICKERGGELNADHIKPWSLYPKLRLELSNGRTLCISCHKKTDTYMGRIKNYKV